MSGRSKDDDSVPSSPPDSEPSPTYSVFHLSKQSLLSSSQIRKQAQLRERTELLRRRNAGVKQKVQLVRQRQEALEAMSASQKLVLLAQANERRRRHLELVRERARTLRAYLYRRLSLDVRLDVPAGREPEELEQPEDDQSMLYSEIQVRSAIVIQRSIRAKLLHRALTCTQTAGIVDRVLAFEASYHDSVVLLTGASADKLSLLFRSFGLPLPSAKGGYASFLYSVVLLSDFQEFAKGTSSNHPGFNVNVADSLRTALSIHLPIILYRYATRVFFQLSRVLRSPLEQASNPFSTPRLILARFWRNYHFFFLLYRANHRIALAQITADALTVANTHLRIMLALDRRDTRSFRLRVRCFDRSYKVLGQAILKESIEWASIGINLDMMCKQIILTDLWVKKLPRGRSPETSYDPYLLSDDLHENCVVTMSIHGETFNIPPNIEISRWREFHFKWYKNQLLRLSHIRAPVVLRSGTRNVSHHEELPLSDLMNMMRPHWGDMEGTDESYLLLCDSRMKLLFHEYYEYCRFLGDPEELNDTLTEFEQLCSLYNLRDMESVDDAQARQYLKLFMLLLMQLLLYASVDNSVAVSFLKVIETEQDLLDEVEFLFHDLDSALRARWASTCILRSLQSFFRFENLYQMTGLTLLRENLGTSFPQLRFGLFYQFIFHHSQCHASPEYLAMSMVWCTKREPSFNAETVNESAWRFFSQVIADFIAGDMQLSVGKKFEKNRIGEIRLFSLFSDKLAEISFRARRLLILSCFSSMLNLNRQQNMILAGILDLQSYSSLDFSTMRSALSEFHYNYLMETASHFSAGTWGLLDAFSDKLREAFRHYNVQFFDYFPHHSEEWKGLYEEVIEFCDMFYMLYVPLLNWFYLDLGNPEYAN